MMGRIATMLAHFYVSPLSEAEMSAVASDWAEALREFPQWAIAEACSEWLRTQERKPTPAAIRRLCQHHFAVVEFTRLKAMRGPTGQQDADRPPVSTEARERMAAKVAEIHSDMAQRVGGRDA